MAYNFFDLGIVGKEVKRRLDMLKDITGTNRVASTDELNNEVNELDNRIDITNNELINTENRLNQSITNNVDTINASISATQTTFNNTIKQAINLNNGVSYIDAGTLDELPSNTQNDDNEDFNDGVLDDDYNILVEVETLKTNVKTLSDDIDDMHKDIDDIHSGVVLWEGNISPTSTNKDLTINDVDKYNQFIIEVSLDELIFFSFVAIKSRHILDGTIEIRGEASYIMDSDTTPELVVVNCEISLKSDTPSLSKCRCLNVSQNSLDNLTLNKVIGII